jgi:hypothetical protein
MMGRHAPDVEGWLRQWSDDLQAAVRGFADTVHDADPRITESVKWRRLTFTVEDNWHHWLCAVGVTRRRVSMLLHKGRAAARPASPAARGGPLPAPAVL